MCNNYPQSFNLLFKKNILNANTLKNIQQHTLRLIELNNTVINLLPIELKTWCRVANYRQHVLILEVNNASKKIRLSYELPRLVSRLRNFILPSLSSIKIIINPSFLFKNQKNYSSSQQISIIKSPQKIVSVLSKESAKIIRDLAKKSPEKIRNKLERLASLGNENRK